jgi:hypothetical protein
MKSATLGLALLLLPSLVFGAGFAKETVFLSQPEVTEGETVRVYAVVFNDATSTFAGSLVFKDGDAPIGSVAVTLAAREAQTGSVSWKPSGGAHDIVVELQDKAGKVAEKQDATFSIKKKPAPAKQSGTSTQVAAAVESSNSIQEQIGNLSPAAESAAAPVFKLVDGGREAIADVLDSQIAKTKPKVTSIPMPVLGEVEGAQTVKTPEPGGWASSIFFTVYFYILTVLRFIVGSAGVFYPLLAVIFFFTLWRMYRRFRRA